MAQSPSDAGTAGLGHASSTTALPTPEAFPFPYASGPYPIQLDLMRHLYGTLERAEVGIVQSPTGTGKSLSLLTSALTWLRHEQVRQLNGELQAYRSTLEQEAAESLARGEPPDPPWVMEKLVNRKRSELESAKERMEEKLRRAREDEKERARRAEYGERARGEGVSDRASKKAKSKPSASAHDDDDDRFLPSASSGTANEDRAALKEGEVYLSAEVRALMAQMNPSLPDPADSPPVTTPKILFASRTHSQLSQVLAELRKTVFGGGVAAYSPPGDDARVSEGMEPVRALALGSRRNLCINPAVLSPSASSSSSGAANPNTGGNGLDERCLDLLSTTHGCSFLPSPPPSASSKNGPGSGLAATDRGRAFVDGAFAAVRDIEDLRAYGEEKGCCPYYGSRALIDQAEIIALPYNLILHSSARATLNIDLASNVLLIDEAHNLIDTVLSLHSVNTTDRALGLAKRQLETYLEKFSKRLKSTNAVRLRQALKVLGGLLAVCASYANASPSAERLLDVQTLMSEMGHALDQINLLDLASWLTESRMAVKVSGYAEKLMDDEIRQQLASDPSRAARLSSAKHSSIAAFHTFTALLRSLTSANADGRVLLSHASTTASMAGSLPSAMTPAQRTVNLKYLLLNPGEMFRDVVAETRSVVLAGGTMEPISDFTLQLVPQLPPSSLSSFSCGHVIPRDNLLTLVLPMGPKGRELEFKFAARGDEALLEELGAALSNACNLVPDGIVVFFPSYAFLEQVKALWTKTGLLQKLDAKKTVFYEPQTSNSVEAVLAEYTNAILNPPAALPSGNPTGDRSTTGSSRPSPKKTGALLFAVVGAKLSEGINFSDRLARAVVMVGLPFPSLASPELKERMRYVEEVALANRRPDAKNAGRELYMNLCMKAVNQSIGRAIRHANDYAVLILIDKRYSQPSIQAKLPGWIMGTGNKDAVGRVVVCKTFGEGVKGLAGFFRAKREGVHGGTT